MDDTVLKLLVLQELLKQGSSESSSTPSIKNVSLMEDGLKVVRGPDWKWENQDGGEGHVGTVVDVAKSDNKQVYVIWDNGTRGNYRVGHSGAYDIRTLDNGSIGVNHPTVTCNSCRKKGVIGMRWKCKVCYDYDLCTRCYMSDKHDTTHTFVRFQTNNGNKVDMPKRQGSAKIAMKGIFSSAKVVRGQDWRWERQDGGPGRSGIVTDVCGWDDNTEWNACHVVWSHNDSSNMYRIGHEGKVDLKYIEEAADGYYYRDHLPITGDEARVVKEEPSVNTRVKETYDRSLLNLCNNMERLYFSGEFCDFTIKVGHREFQIHKAILAAHSSVFFSMFQHDMKEKISGMVDIPDIDPDVFEDLLLYLYSGKFKNISSSNIIDLYEVAEKYDVQCLKEDCVDFMKKNLSIDTVCDIMALAFKYTDKELIDCGSFYFMLHTEDILLTQSWQNFLTENPRSANDLYIKALRFKRGLFKTFKS